MSAYCTQADLVDRFGSAQLLLLADRDADGVADAAVVAGVIADASDIVDLHVRGKYAIPLSPIDGVVVGIACDLARTRFYANATDVPESVLNADKAARDLLRWIASGELKLDAAAASATESDGAALDVEISGDGPFFTSDSLKGF